MKSFRLSSDFIRPFMYVMPGCSGCAGGVAGCGAVPGAEVSVGNGAASDAEVSAIYNDRFSIKNLIQLKM
jgi:hypothetical protein